MALTLAHDLNPRVPANAVKIVVVGFLLVVTYLPALSWLHEKYSGRRADPRGRTR